MQLLARTGVGRAGRATQEEWAGKIMGDLMAVGVGVVNLTC